MMYSLLQTCFLLSNGRELLISVACSTPCTRRASGRFLVAHNLLLSHGLAVQAFQRLALEGEIGITLNIQLVHHATERVEDVAAARRLDGVFNRWHLDPLFRGEYPQDVWELLAAERVAPPVQEGDMQLIG